MAGASKVDHVEIVLLDNAIEMHVDKIEARCRSPMSQQSRLDVFQREGLLEEGIIKEINLADGQVVRRPPIRIHRFQFFFGQYVWHNRLLYFGCVPVAYAAVDKFLSWFVVANYLFNKTATPGSSLPSKNSNDAPPPVETWVTR